MPEVHVQDIFTTPWGVVEPYREEVLNGGPGALEAMERIAMKEQFYGIEVVAEKLKKSISTARRRAKEYEYRFIIKGRKFFYYRGDINYDHAGKK